jgi:hypothetical protein
MQRSSRRSAKCAGDTWCIDRDRGSSPDYTACLRIGDVTGNNGNGVFKLVFTILSAEVEAERERTKERIAEVKADQRKRGRYLGGKVPWAARLRSL